MKKRTIINILLAFLLVPILKLANDYIKIEILGDYSAYSGSFFEYEKLIASSVFFWFPVIFILLVLLPYNLIIIKKKPVVYWHKLLIFSAILISLLCFFGSFMNVWLYPYWQNVYYLFYFLPISLIFSTLIHFLVDKNDNNLKVKSSID